jgi:2-polyprenyl-3-methyl-5-hydroxy-6-metoxy-1,4-benzoquinol methylase
LRATAPDGEGHDCESVDTADTFACVFTGRGERVSEVVSHWDGVYSSAPSTTKSWYEREPTHSLRLVTQAARDCSAAIIDIGAGTSMLVDRLLESGFTDVTVLDISAHALEEVRRRLGERANTATFITSDVLSWQPDLHYDVWHDRAVFHFLTEPSQRAHYVSLAEAGIRQGGLLIVATFAEDGPTQCSGLDVTRYSADDLAATFAAGFEPVLNEREAHHTPTGAIQPFTWTTLRRT